MTPEATNELQQAITEAKRSDVSSVELEPSQGGDLFLTLSDGRTVNVEIKDWGGGGGTLYQRVTRYMSDMNRQLEGDGLRSVAVFRARSDFSISDVEAELDEWLSKIGNNNEKTTHMDEIVVDIGDTRQRFEVTFDSTGNPELQPVTTTQTISPRPIGLTPTPQIAHG